MNQKLEFDSKRIYQCIHCPVGKRVIEMYFSFYPNFNDTQISEIASLLHMDMLSADEEKKKRENFINCLTSNRPSIPQTYIETINCIEVINWILSDLKFLFSVNEASLEKAERNKSKDVMTIYEGFSRIPDRGAETLRKMYEYNSRPNQSEEEQPELSYLPKWNKAYRQKTEKYISSALNDPKTDMNRGIVKKACREMFNILKNYCNSEDEVFCFCSSVYQGTRDSWLKEKYKIDIRELRDCQSELFFQLKKENHYPIFDDISALTEENQEIIYLYLKKVTKHFGRNLKRLMANKGMSENTIAVLLEEKVSQVQSLIDCPVHLHERITIKKLARVFLVSEDVLYSGIGKSYGNWMSVLSEEGITFIQEKQKKRQAKMGKNDIKDYVRKEIIKILKMDDDSFQKELQTNSNFFAEEDTCLYLETEEDETYYDYNSMYQNALSQDTIKTLVKVLLEIQQSSSPPSSTTPT